MRRGLNSDPMRAIPLSAGMDHGSLTLRASFTRLFRCMEEPFRAAAREHLPASSRWHPRGMIGGFQERIINAVLGQGQSATR